MSEEQGRVSEEPTIDVIIPAFNEVKSIPLVLQDIPDDLVNEVVVVNNRSTDGTEEIARREGAVVLNENRQGYGYACLKGINYLKNRKRQPDIVVFIDADYSDYPGEMPDVVAPILEDDYDMVIGSRARGEREKGSMMPQQIFGNWLATRLIRLFYNVTFTDLGPFRAIKFQKLLDLDMQDTTFGWTVEMQIKAIKNKLKFTEVPVSYRKRVGVSKIAGTLSGSVKAGYKIIYTILKYTLK